MPFASCRLYRVCFLLAPHPRSPLTVWLPQVWNGIQLNRVLPPGPREYWNELDEQHKKIPEHQKWMYESDPFAARKAVDERQALAAKKKDENEPSSSRPSAAPTKESIEFANAPEVKMASDHRDLVESSIKKVLSAPLTRPPTLTISCRLSLFTPRRRTLSRSS